MNRQKVFLFFSVVLTLALASCSGGIPASPSDIETKPVSLEIPKAEVWELENGLKVFYYYNDELPQMSVALYLPGGSLFDPKSKIGLASAVGTQLREGGIPGYQPDALDEHLASLAASIESSYGKEYGTVGMFALEEDFESVFSLFSDVVLRPAFNQKRLSLWKFLKTEGIRRRGDSPTTMGRIAYTKLIHGENSAYANFSSAESINRITQKDLFAFHSKFFRPNGSRLAISGSLSREALEPIIERHFGSWAADVSPLPQLPDLTEAEAPGIYLLNRPFDQATVILGHPGPARHSKDQFSIKAYSQILGHGGFSSLLFHEIRSRLGLAYSVTGGFSAGIKRGAFTVGMQTRTTAVPEALDATLEIVKKMSKEEPAEEIFSEAKSSKLRSFVFRFSSPDAIVDRAATHEILGFPADYDARFTERFSAVTPADVLTVAQQRVDLAKLRIVVVGNVEPGALEALSSQLSLPIFKVDFTTTAEFGEELK